MCQTIFWKEDTVLMQIQFKLPSLFPLTEQFFLLYPSYSPCIWTSIIWTGLFSFPLQGFWVFTIQIMSGESEVTARAATVGRSHREHSEPYCEVKNVCLDVIHVFQEPSVRSTWHWAGLLTRDLSKRGTSTAWLMGDPSHLSSRGSRRKQIGEQRVFLTVTGGELVTVFFIWGVLSFMLDRLFGEIGAT